MTENRETRSEVGSQELSPDRGRALSNWRLAWIVSQHEARNFWLGWFLWAVFFTLPAAVALVLGQSFDALADGDTGRVYRWLAMLVVVEVARMGVVHAGAVVYTKAWVHQQTFLRANLLAAQVASGGDEAGRPVGSAGEAITHFRDDTDDVANFIDNLVDVSGGITFAVVAVLVLGNVSPSATAVLIIPLVLVAVAARMLGGRIQRYRAEDRRATGAVTQLVGDAMSAATTIKVNDAAGPVLARLQGRVDHRRDTAVRDRVVAEMITATGHGSTDIGLGLVLLVGAGALAAGTFSVGEVALFVAFLSWLSFLPRMIGLLLASSKQVNVAAARMSSLVAGGDVHNTVRARQLPINRHQPRARPTVARPDRVPLQRMELRSLSATYADGAGVHDISFSIDRGDFVVLTGPIGAGKSTLLRAVLGLAADAEVGGEVRWNDTVVDDRGSFLVPPNAAFLPQVPQLISDSLADNVAFGDADIAAVAASLQLAELAPDVDAMPDGTHTLIGPRGLRLSGGQRQRLAAARAIVHRPELVILDDLSSALDVETELALWDNMAAAGLTALAVSHRAVAFERATRVLRLEAGRLR